MQTARKRKDINEAKEMAKKEREKIKKQKVSDQRLHAAATIFRTYCSNCKFKLDMADKSMGCDYCAVTWVCPREDCKIFLNMHSEKFPGWIDRPDLLDFIFPEDA